MYGVALTMYGVTFVMYAVIVTMYGVIPNICRSCLLTAPDRQSAQNGTIIC